MSTTANASSASGIDFHRTFGVAKPATPVGGKGNSGDRPKAKFWLNIGYDSGVADESTGGTKFVSLPVGIPLDNNEKLPTNSRNAEFAAFQAARNDLMEQVMAVAGNLAPGEEKLLNLQIQLRRVNDEAAEIPVENNPFAKKLAL